MSGIGGAIGGGLDYRGRGDKGLRMSLSDTFRLAWADPDLRQKLIFILIVFGIYAMCVHVPVPIPGVNPLQLEELMSSNALFQLINTFGGGALKRVSIFALGLGPYITSSIIMQILTTAMPAWKKELQEGGEYARRQQNKRTRLLTIALCLFQGSGFINLLAQGVPAVNALSLYERFTILVFWTAGAMFILWLGEQLSEKGIGNGVSLLIFAGIVISLPNLISIVVKATLDGVIGWWQVIALVVIFFAITWFIVLFTIAQRRIPIQHMRRQLGTKMVGGATSYLPFSINMAGVIPIIFAVSLIYMPAQFASMLPPNSAGQDILMRIADFMSPNFTRWEGIVGCLVYALLIFFFTYFYTAIQYNVEDIANNLKRGGSFIPGVRPGKQTKDFLDAVISRITIVGACFLSIVALSAYIVPAIIPIQAIGLLFGTSLLIMVSVALETMRQIEANILMKQYGQ